MATKVVLILILCIITATPSTAEVYEVGDEGGWTSDIEIDDYAILKWADDDWSWAWSKKFYVGDVLLFNYDNRYDSVLQVTRGDELLCKTSNPIATYNSGSDAVKLDSPGEYFFISGVYDHCWNANQKLQIFVYPNPPTPA